jgi:hypothetical protein
MSLTTEILLRTEIPVSKTEPSIPRYVQDFPNAERFRRQLTRIAAIEFFKPKKEPDSSVLQRLVNLHLRCLGLEEAKILLAKDWSEAENAGLYAMDDAKFDAKYWAVKHAAGWKDTQYSANHEAGWRDTQYSVNHEARHAGWQTTVCETPALKAIWDIALNKTRSAETKTDVDVVGDIVGNAAWIIAKDKMFEMGYAGNPFAPLIVIYKLGCLPIGLVENSEGEAEGKMEFVIFIPPIQPKIE